MNKLSWLRTGNGIAGRLAPKRTAMRARHQFMTPREMPFPERELACLQAARQQTLAGGIDALHWGKAGPLVLMMHGMDGRPTQFHSLIEALLERGYQIIAPWGAAHGGSAGAEAHPLAFAQTLLETADHFPDIHAVIGHSMGAAAAAIALECGLPAGRAVMIGSPASLIGVMQRFARFIGLPESAFSHFQLAVEDRVGIPAEELELERHSWQQELPALVVHDRDDRIVPYSEAERIIAAAPSARLLATSGLGHHRILRDAAVVAEVTKLVDRASRKHRLVA